MYVDYVNRKYRNAAVVFDGYEDGPSTKDATHLRRTGASVGPKVNFSSDMVITSRKEEFLANQDNKQRFIHLLSEKLLDAGCTVYQAKGDADVLIAQTVVESAGTKATFLLVMIPTC
ncbi:MAG: hypothetical protein JAZ03_11705 [Candidatus Thiodiazotropha taylori]|nr:hypothetical protein [Candidatus Thiodiazotropha taylori]MCW4334590.1 hypothetical protein [Candidatus Thiodiazotropha endolucinida]